MIGETDRPAEDYRSDAYLHTQAALIRSSPILALALGAPEMNQLAVFDGVRNRVAYLKSHLDVSVGEKDEIVRVALAAGDPDEAERVVSAVVEAYTAYQSKQRRSTATELFGILRAERDRSQADLDGKLDRMAAQRAELNTLTFAAPDNGTGQGGNLALRRLAAMGDALTAAQVETVKAKSAFDESLAASGLSADAVPDDATTSLGADDLARLKGDLFALSRQLNDLRDRFLPNHPTVRRAEARLRELQSALVAVNRRQWRSSTQREADLQASFDRQQQEAMGLNAAAAQYARLDADAGGLRARIADLDRRMGEMALAESAGALNITVVEPASIDPELDAPSVPRTMALALLAGLASGCVLAVGREWTDPVLGDSGDVRASLGLPVLGEVPDAGPNRPAAQLAWVSHVEPAGAFAAALRDVLIGLHLGSPNGSYRTLLVTSPGAADGKSVVAANLAIALARAGRRVCAVDANLDRPSLHRAFDVDHTAGLCDVLEGAATADEVTRRTAVANLDVLPAGHPGGVASAADLLNGPAFDELLERLTERYDHVILDAAEATSDAARVIAGACDRTLLVVRGRRSPRRVAARARDGLLDVGAGLAGVVVNAVRSPGGGRGGPPADYASVASPGRAGTAPTSDVGSAPSAGVTPDDSAQARVTNIDAAPDRPTADAANGRAYAAGNGPDDPFAVPAAHHEHFDISDNDGPTVAATRNGAPRLPVRAAG